MEEKNEDTTKYMCLRPTSEDSSGNQDRERGLGWHSRSQYLARRTEDWIFKIVLRETSREFSKSGRRLRPSSLDGSGSIF